MTVRRSEPGPDIVFRTSGTTGRPVTWLRTAGQLRAEGELLAGLTGPADQVVSYAPPHHLYGRVFGVELPRLLGASVTDHGDTPLVPPALDPGARTVLVCLPSSWQLLLRRLPELAACREVVAVHSTARVPGAAYEVTRRLAGTGFRALEVLGSTETGAVATRPLDPALREDGVWQLLPDVSWAGAAAIRPSPADDTWPDAAAEAGMGSWVGPGAGAKAGPAACGESGPVTDRRAGPVRLTVGGSRLARRPGAPRPDTVTMPDLVVPAGPRGFRRLGRSPGLVKVNGVRCDLGLVELLAREAFPEADTVCVPLDDEIRGEHYAMYYASPSGTGTAEFRSRLAAVLGTVVPGPRSVIQVREVPRSGDIVLIERLREMAGRTS
ncbi:MULTISPECIES: AMP-binding protein [Streptomyces]|uniref:Acyl-CoA synthetase n=1 Tax=Streptomyces venezuelae TaxID=54571 RepID=A0A5P2AM73_STRVZ|nr:AMP-binding protein [Streptomyces venezuelae]QES19076.1 acyl-CoA synthetase [Streptomyces venezuelae]